MNINKPSRKLPNNSLKPVMDKRPIRWELDAIRLLSSCYGNRNKLRRCVAHSICNFYLFYHSLQKKRYFPLFFLSRANASAMRVRKVDPLVRDLCFTLARKAHAREFQKISPVL